MSSLPALAAQTLARMRERRQAIEFFYYGTAFHRVVTYRGHYLRAATVLFRPNLRCTLSVAAPLTCEIGISWRTITDIGTTVPHYVACETSKHAHAPTETNKR